VDAIDWYHGLVRKDALQILPEKVGRLLDFGGGIGGTAAALRETGRAEHVVLFDQVAAHALPAIDAAEAFDFEDPEAIGTAAGQHGPFDTILALDILEHLRDPWVAITALAEHLRPGGRLLVSVPNIGCYRVLLPLIFRDDFDYKDADILDRTHLRWFTRRSTIALATTPPGMVVETVEHDPYPIRHKLANALTLGLLPRLLAQQWLVMARKQG